jgi:hypothetical protein
MEDDTKEWRRRGIWQIKLFGKGNWHTKHSNTFVN